MAKKQKKSDAPAGAPMWMVTYGDMMTLLLTFFVLIVSFSSVQDVEFKEALGSLKGALGILGQSEYIISLGKIMIPESVYSIVSRQMQQTTGDISKKLNFVSDYENVKVFSDNRGLNIILPANLLFKPGDDKLNASSFPLLKKIGAFLFELKDNNFLIEGHTDDTPIHTLRFPSNWHLSSSRAISVADFLHQKCDIGYDRLVVSGRAEYDPIAPNDTEENKKKNRRVAILIQTKTDPVHKW